MQHNNQLVIQLLWNYRIIWWVPPQFSIYFKIIISLELVDMVNQLSELSMQTLYNVNGINSHVYIL